MKRCNFFKLFILVGFSAVILQSCDAPAKNLNQPLGEFKEQNGFSYVVTEIEGRKFIAYQAAYGYWELAGPID